VNLNVEQKLKLEKLAADNGLRFIVLFGSQADDTANENSDYDLAIMAERPEPLYDNFSRFGKILNQLSTLLQISEEKLDLTDLHNEDILLRYQIVLTGKLLVGDIDDYEDFRSFVIREYQGAARLRELETIIVKRRQNLLTESLT